MVAYAITFVDDVAMWVPSLDTWDQFVWLPVVAMPRAAMEVEQYGYCRGQAIDLRPVMPATQFRVTDEAGTYLCASQALVFEGSILAYNPTRDEAEWVPVCGTANDLSWAEEKSAVALVNYVPCASQEGACIARLWARRLVSWPNNSSSQEEEEEDVQEEEEEQGEAGSKPPSDSVELKQGETEQEAEPCRQRRSWEWGLIVEEEERLAFADPWLDSDATAGGHSLGRLTPRELGSPREMVVKVHARELEVEEL